jgi:FtsH-binding integral membrane protein
MESQYVNTSAVSSSVAAKILLQKVFTFMAGGLTVTGVLAYMFGTNASLFNYLVSQDTGSHTALGWVVMFAPLVLVLIMSGAYRKFSTQGLLLTFIAFSAIMGISLSYIFFMYPFGTISTTFFITAGTFGIMALLGFTTQTDLSKMGSLLMMGLFGIILASVVNMFIGSGFMDYIISILGVLIFTGLTAYDVQKIKRLAEAEPGAANDGKIAIMGALTLYLDFINLFLFLLRFFGGNRD